MADYIRNEDGTMRPSPEHINAMADRYLRSLDLRFGRDEGVPTLKETPLSELLAKKETVWITCQPHPNPERRPEAFLTFYAHLRTALLANWSYRQSLKDGMDGMSCIVRDPMILLNEFFSDDGKPDLINTGLLVILAPEFPYYSAAQLHIGSLIRLRQGMARPTFFVSPERNDLLTRTDTALDKEFVHHFNDERMVKRLLLRDIDLPPLVKRVNGASIPGIRLKAKAQEA